MKYTDKIKSGFPVVDEVIAQNWDLVKEYVKRAEKWEEANIDYHNTHNRGQRGFREMPPFRPWDDRQKLFAAIGCVTDLTKALGKVITREDTLVESTMDILDGCLQGTGTISRDGETFDFTTSSHHAGGWNIQCYHMRYRIKTTLPKIKLPKDALALLEKQESNLRSISYNEERLVKLKENLEKSIKEVQREEENTREKNDKRITDHELEQLEKGYIGKNGFFTVYWLGDRPAEEFKTFEEYIPNRCQNAWDAGRSILERAKEDVIRFTTLIEQAETKITNAKKELGL
jgi:hypothetical protein